jgi:AraC-like DNA-binding protein
MPDTGLVSTEPAGSIWNGQPAPFSWHPSPAPTPLRRRTGSGRQHASSLAITAKAKQFIECNFADRITLRQLQAVTGCSTFAIMRAFRRCYGMTFHAFLMVTRVSRATQLLAQGESAAETALAVGFVDQSHFIRHFKRVLGTTPKRFVSALRGSRAHACSDGR